MNDRFFTSLPLNQDEWQTGLKALGVDSLSKLKKVLPELENEVFASLATVVAIIVKSFLVDE